MLLAIINIREFGVAPRDALHGHDFPGVQPADPLVEQPLFPQTKTPVPSPDLADAVALAHSACFVTRKQPSRRDI